MAGTKSKSASSATKADTTQKDSSNSDNTESVVIDQTNDKAVTGNGSVSQTSSDTNIPSRATTTTASVGGATPVTDQNVSAVYGNYDDYQLLPDAPWPPPIFIKQNVSPQERYYIEHRWYSQWSFFDKKATENKTRYYRTQLIVGIGSVTVPVLVGINIQGQFQDVLYVITVVISLAVAISTAVESLYTFGDNWRSYRSAAEDLHQEKSIYDVKAGRYQSHPQAFLRFVERCEEIIAQQNGRWIQSQEKSADEEGARDDEIFAISTDSTVDQYGNPIPTASEVISSEPDVSAASETSVG